jgi:hypothetical protein
MEDVAVLSNFSIVRAWPDAVEYVKEYHRKRWTMLFWWALASLVCAAGLLALTYVVGMRATPDPTPPGSPFGSMSHIMKRNLMVLALHSCSCIGIYIARVTLPEDIAYSDSAAVRWLGTWGARLSIAFVPFATLFSIGTQALVNGEKLSTLAMHLMIPVRDLLMTVLPHALPELVAVFLPLGALLVLTRAGHWDQLIAATFVTTVIALPIIYFAARIEANDWQTRVARAQDNYPDLRNRTIASTHRSVYDSNSWNEYLRLDMRELDRRFATMDDASKAARQQVGKHCYAVVHEAGALFVYRLALTKERRVVVADCESLGGTEMTAEPGVEVLAIMDSDGKTQSLVTALSGPRTD